jgi:hypothetical protein
MDDVAKAREVESRGWPSRDLPVAQRRAAYEELEAAYYVLEEDAAADGYLDRAKYYNELAEKAYRAAVDSSGGEQRW